MPSNNESKGKCDYCKLLKIEHIIENNTFCYMYRDIIHECHWLKCDYRSNNFPCFALAVIDLIFTQLCLGQLFM